MSRTMRILALALLGTLTFIVGQYALLLFVFRMDTAAEFRLAVASDIFIGPLSSLLLILWFRQFFKKRFKNLAFVISPIAALMISTGFLFVHITQVINRGGNPIRLLFWQ